MEVYRLLLLIFREEQRKIYRFGSKDCLLQPGAQKGDGLMCGASEICLLIPRVLLGASWHRQYTKPTISAGILIFFLATKGKPKTIFQLEAAS